MFVLWFALDQVWGGNAFCCAQGAVCPPGFLLSLLWLYKLYLETPNGPNQFEKNIWLQESGYIKSLVASSHCSLSWGELPVLDFPRSIHIIMRDTRNQTWKYGQVPWGTLRVALLKIYEDLKYLVYISITLSQSKCGNKARWCGLSIFHHSVHISIHFCVCLPSSLQLHDPSMFLPTKSCFL